MNVFYTAFDVLKRHIEKQGLKMNYFSLAGQSPNRVIMWVEDNPQGITHFVCVKMDCTQFLIWGYNNNYEQIVATGYDYADVNTPDFKKERE